MGRRTAFAAVAAAVLTLPLLPTTVAHADAATPSPPPVGGLERQAQVSSNTNTIIVTFDRAQANPKQAATDAVEQPADRLTGADITKVTPITSKIVAVTLSQPVTMSQASAVGKQAEQVDEVKAAEPAATFTTGTASDPDYYPDQWNLKADSSSSYGVNAEAAWAIATGAGAVVGVVDTGITAHPDLSGSSTSIVGGNVIAGYDFITDSTRAGDGDGRDADPTDPGDYCTSPNPDVARSSWHGTHVAGIVAAIRDNNLGVVGVAPGAKVEPLRALGRCGGLESDVIAAMLWGAGIAVPGLPANPNPVGVLNLSLGALGSCSVAMQSAVDSVVAKGVPVVVAAMNNSTTLSTSSPASCGNVIRVVASTYEGARASYSNYGSSTSPATIAAPGGSGATSGLNDWILSTWNDGTLTPGAPSYRGMFGTSMATPHVAAVIAMLEQIDPTLSPATIQDYLTSTATPMPSCSTTECGAGIVNAARAVAWANGPGVIAGLRTPIITGIPVAGGRLSTVGAGSNRATYSYQWLQNGNPVAGAIAASYDVAASDLGSALSVTVTASIADLTGAKTSAPVMIIGNTVASLDTPAIAGKAAVGQTLTTSGTGATYATYTYQWYRSGSMISGATASSYLLTASDYGKRIAVRVTASLLGQQSSRTSGDTAKVVSGRFANPVRPYLTGTFVKGHTLKANLGTWAPTPSKVTYRWLRNGASITGATKSSYKLGSKDKGRSISVRITVSRSRYLTTSATSTKHRIR